MLETCFAVLQNWVNGLSGLANVVRLGVKALISGKGDFKGKLIESLLAPEGTRSVMAFLRAFWPTVVTERKAVTAYENNGTVVVTRRSDIDEILLRDDDFAVVYEPRMREITQSTPDVPGKNFFLGMQPSWDYTRDTSAMRLAMRNTDVAEIVLPRANEVAERAVAEADGVIDLPQDIALRTSSDMVGHYFGTPGPSRAKMIDWTTTMFWYLFGDLRADPALGARARTAMAESRRYLDKTIAARKAGRSKSDDVVGRCIAMQKAKVPGVLTDEDIRNNIVGLLIGAVPTLSKASCLALEELLKRPGDLRGAQKAARDGDDALLAQYLWEALRFNPHQPLVYRRAVRDAVIAKGTLRETTIPEGRLVFAMTLSAAFDTLDVPLANEFRTNRPPETYKTWGYGMHNCFGDAINRAVIPAILKPVLKLKNLRYADGWEAIEKEGTPFPVHMKLAYDLE
ncbi:MAG: cytochrome P450 [Pseudomonadota bacterium]